MMNKNHHYLDIKNNWLFKYFSETNWEFEHNNTGISEETQTFLEEHAPNLKPPVLSNYRRKGLASMIYHHNPNHKNRLQYSLQDINPSTYGNGNYSFF